MIQTSYPSLWQSWGKDAKNKKVIYNDFEYHVENGIHNIKYDLPHKQTCNNHMVKKGALFFRREKKGDWRLVGTVIEVHKHAENNYVSLDVKELHFNELFKTKSSAAVAFGFNPLNEGNRQNGLIKLITVL